MTASNIISNVLIDQLDLNNGYSVAVLGKLQLKGKKRYNRLGDHYLKPRIDLTFWLRPRILVFHFLLFKLPDVAKETQSLLHFATAALKQPIEQFLMDFFRS